MRAPLSGPGRPRSSSSSHATPDAAAPTPPCGTSRDRRWYRRFGQRWRDRPTAEPEPDAELSAAARAVVHDAGDPRIDAHLAALGLGPDPAPATSRRAHAAADDELTVLRDRVAALERELA